MKAPVIGYRISGDDVLNILKKITKKNFSKDHSLIRIVKIYQKDDSILDECSVVFFKSPKSFTGEDVCEIFLHGSPLIASQFEQLLKDLKVPGLRLAKNGEFSYRSVLNSKGNWIENDNIKIFDLSYDQLSKFKIGSIDKKSKYGRRFDNQKSLGEVNIPKLSDLLKLTSNNISDDLIINLEIKSTPVEDNLTPPPNVMANLIIDEVNKTKLKNKVIYSSFESRN